jgi:hypothetical protein
MGYEEKREKFFLLAFVVTKGTAKGSAHDLPWRRDGLVMGRA